MKKLAIFIVVGMIALTYVYRTVAGIETTATLNISTNTPAPSWTVSNYMSHMYIANATFLYNGSDTFNPELYIVRAGATNIILRDTVTTTNAGSWVPSGKIWLSPRQSIMAKSSKINGGTNCQVQIQFATE